MNCTIKTLNITLLTLILSGMASFSFIDSAQAHQHKSAKPLIAFEQNNKKVARKFLKALGQKDMKKVQALMSDDFSFQNGMNPKRQHGKEVFTDWWYSMVHDATKLEPNVLRMSVMGNTVLAESKFLYEDENTSRTFRGTKFIHIKNGKVSEYQEYRLPSNKTKM